MRLIGRTIKGATSVLLLACLAPAAGCSGFRAPAVAVDEVAVTDVTDEALAVTFAMELRNPNTAPLELYEFRYSLAVDGKQVYAGRHAGGATVSPAGTRRLTIPAVIPFELAGWTRDQVPAAAPYTLKGKLQYHAPNNLATLLLDAGVRRPKVGFKSRGDLRLR